MPVVDVAPNFAVISDYLVDCPMQWLGGEWKQAARSDCRQSGVDPGHGDGNVPKPLGKRRVFSLRGAFGLSSDASDPSESDRAVIASGLHGTRRGQQRRPCTLVGTVEQQADDGTYQPDGAHVPTQAGACHTGVGTDRRDGGSGRAQAPVQLKEEQRIRELTGAI